MTAAGRGVATVLMVSGIAFFGVLTANIAAFFVERDAEEHDPSADLARRLDAIEARLESLVAELRQARPNKST